MTKRKTRASEEANQVKLDSTKVNEESSPHPPVNDAVQAPQGQNDSLPTPKRKHVESDDAPNAQTFAESPLKKEKFNASGASSHFATDQPSASAITADEAKLYDRQIRLWGMDAQTRIRGANVLMIGVNGLSGEVMKNIVLAGVGSICICNDEYKPTNESRPLSEQDASQGAVVEMRDLGALFFLRESDIGKNKAHAIVDRVKALNPHVDVSVAPGTLSSLPDSFFKKFTLAALTGDGSHEFATLMRVNRVCREAGIPFWASCMAGTSGFIFCDLGNAYTYICEKKIRESVRKQGFDEPQTIEVTHKSTHTAAFKPMSQDLILSKFPPGYDAFKTAKQKKRFLATNSFVYFAWALIWHCQHSNASEIAKPTEKKISNGSVLDRKVILGERQRFLERVGVDSSVLPEESLRLLLETRGRYIAPACAVQGGFLAQEFLKVLSEKERPFCNFFCYDALSSQGVVMPIGLSHENGIATEQKI